MKQQLKYLAWYAGSALWDIRKSNQPGTDWESDFATLTVEVKQK
jgi:hypothetical protein